MLNRMLDGGFFCPAVLRHDPWLESLRGTPAFTEVVQRAEAKSRDAEDEFTRLGGDKILL
jgi:hypothetical protein